MLIDEHAHSTFRLAYRMTGNEADAEDVVQETFLRAYRQLGRFDSRAKFSSWIHRIASNYAIDLIRRRKRWGLSALDDHAPLQSATPDPERATESAEFGDEIEEALATLTPRERVAFVMRHHQGCSIREIGSVLGTRDNATKNHIFRAVRKLRRALAPFAERVSGGAEA